MRIIFMGTPEFSVSALQAICAAGHEVVACYSQPPRKAGRGHKITPSAVHQAAENLGIPIYHPASLKSQEQQEIFAAHGADIAVVVAYGLLLPEGILDVCRCINIHASLLPRWRGAAPIHRAIEAGDAETGITIMDMDEGLDTGDMLLIERCTIAAEMNMGTLHDSLKKMGAKLVVSALEQIEEGTDTPVSQQGEACYACKVSKEEAEINWCDSVVLIDRKIRAFNPYPAAFMIHDGERIKILEADFKQQSHDQIPGTVNVEDFSIYALDGIIYPKKLQRAGKKAMSVGEMLRGMG
jgi:methionyl-tRNA formyltransferase